MVLGVAAADAAVVTARRERAARWLTVVFAGATVLAAVLWLVTRWNSHRGSWVELVFAAVNVPLSGSLVSVAVLALLTRALLGRKRAGLVGVALFQILGLYLGIAALVRVAPFQLLRHWSLRWGAVTVIEGAVSVVAAVVVLIMLWWLRPAFPGHLPRGSWLWLVGVLAGGLTVTVAITWILLNLADTGRFSEIRQLLATLARSFGDVDADTARELAGVPGWIPQVTSLLVTLTLLGAVTVFLRSASRPTVWTADRELALRRLLHAHGSQDSLGYFATRRDKSSVFTSDRSAAIAYRVAGGVSLASGNPIGERAGWPSAIEAWKSEARFYGWLPAVLAASEDGARCYAAAGFAVLGMGDEAILRPDQFSLDRTSLSAVRHAVARARRAGLTVDICRQYQVPEEELQRLVAAAAAWRDEQPERGFSMALNRAGDPADRQVLVVVARNPAGTPVGLLTFVPWGRRGLSLDQMRRSPQAPNGVTELMVAEVMAAAPGLGITRVSLNFCMFRGSFADADRLGAGTVTRLNSSVLGFFDRFWQLERLYRANQKFDPQWCPRYLCYDSRLALPQVVAVAAGAEGFLPSVRSEPSPTLSATDLAAVRALEEFADPAPPGPARSDSTLHRMAHLDRLAELGRSPYPIGLAGPTLALTDLARLLAHPAMPAHPAGIDPAMLTDPDPQPYQTSVAASGMVRVAARVAAIRDHGGIVFADLTADGASAQAVLEAAVVGTEQTTAFSRLVDRGDLVLMQGRPGVSRTGTPSLLVHDWQMAAKALHPVPFRRFTDPQARARQRSLDLLVHPADRDRLRRRSAVVSAVRTSLRDHGFMEVETPILHTVHGGASARPFTTYSNAYGLHLSLRIAPELYLKRLLVAGFGPIFEIGRNFRNEGADATHNPEFTSLEAYQPWADYTTMRHLTEQLVRTAASAVHGRPVLPLTVGDGSARLVDLSAEWPVVPVLDAVSAATGTAIGLDMDFDELLSVATRHQVAVRDDMGAGAVIEELYGKLVEPATIEPTFYLDFPAETSPLTGPHRRHPGLVERWDLVINGTEIATAYSELTDPLEQRRRLTAQSLKAAAGDAEAMQVDEDFLAALEIGMPPTGGLGLGIDRLAMLITGSPIRGVLTFPFLRPSH